MGQIRALTGVRFFAALYVIGFHHYLRFPNVLREGYPHATAVLRPVLQHGNTGVDLFFVLSGFVLAHNYLGALGERWSTGDALRFYWYRLARIWPLYVAALLIAAAFIWVRGTRWGSAPLEVLTWPRFADQLLMVDMWHRPVDDGATWAGPMWTISVEWLAYLLFPALALVVLRLRDRLPVWSLYAGAGVAMLPMLALTWVGQGVNTLDWQWVARIGCEFVAGMLVSAATSRLAPGPVVRRRLDAAAIAAVVAVLALMYLADRAGTAWQGQLAIALYLPVVACLALADGPLSRLLSTRTLVLGGAISYGMYLIHSQFLYLYRDTAAHVLHWDGIVRQRGEVVVIVGIVVAAWVLHRLVEEPCRRAMSRRVDKPGVRPSAEVR